MLGGVKNEFGDKGLLVVGIMLSDTDGVMWVASGLINRVAGNGPAIFPE